MCLLVSVHGGIHPHHPHDPLPPPPPPPTSKNQSKYSSLSLCMSWQTLITWHQTHTHPHPHTHTHTYVKLQSLLFSVSRAVSIFIAESCVHFGVLLLSSSCNVISIPLAIRFVCEASVCVAVWHIYNTYMIAFLYHILYCAYFFSLSLIKSFVLRWKD